jgi:hypothetical protein
MLLVDVDSMSHALALHEVRGPFTPTLMHIKDESKQELDQVWFIGSHGDVGRENEQGCIGDIVLAWLISKLEAVGVKFDEEKLEVRFPRLQDAHPLLDAQHHEWVHDPVRRSAKV